MRSSGSRAELLRQILPVGLFIAVHLGATLGAPLYFTSVGLVTLFWPATGIALAAVLAGGPAYAVATLVSCVIAAVLVPEKGLVQVYFTGANVLEILVARFWLLRVAKIDISFDRSSQYLKFILFAGILLPIPGALIAAWSLKNSGNLSAAFLLNAQEWWMSDSLAIISLTPLLLIWRTMPEGWQNGRKLAEAAVGLLLTAVASIYFLGGPGENAAAYPRAFMFFIFVAWAATRFGRHVTLLVTSIVVAVAIASATAQGKTPINYANVWLFMVTLSTLGMTLATVFNERFATLKKNAQLLEAYRAEEARRRASDQALQKSAIDFQRLVETATEGVWTVDKKGQTTFVNRRMAEMLGCTTEFMVGKSFFDFMPADDQADGGARLSRRNSGIAEIHESVLIHRDGSQLWTLMSTSPLSDVEGNITGAMALVSDITERKRAEMALRETEERYRKIIEGTSDAVLVHQSGIVLFANSAAAELFGEKDAEKLIGVNSLQFIHPDDQSMLIERMKELFRKPSTAFLPRIKQRVLRKGGEIVWIESATTTITYNGRAALLVIANRTQPPAA